jgi:hypothetical protein
MGEMKTAQKFVPGNLDGRNYLGQPDAVGRIILKLI